MEYGPEVESALLIGEGLRHNLELTSLLSRLGLSLRFASSGYDGIEELSRNSIEIVLVDANDDNLRPHEICRKIKLSTSREGVPVVCVYEGEANISHVLDSFHAGADDCFTGTINSIQFLAKVEWLMTRRNSAAALRQYYSELRSRQAQTLDVVKATADLMDSIDAGFRDRIGIDGSDNRELFEERLEIGIGMIKSLTSILENQIDSFDISELMEQTDTPSPIYVDRQFPSPITPETLATATVC